MTHYDKKMKKLARKYFGSKRKQRRIVNAIDIAWAKNETIKYLGELNEEH